MINWSSLIPSIMFVATLLVIFVYFIRRSAKQDMTIEAFSNIYNVIVSDLDLKDYKIDITTTSDKSMEGVPVEIRAIAANFNKGYDFLHFKLSKLSGDVPEHFHRKSNELLYVLNGSIEIETLNSSNSLLHKILKVDCIPDKRTLSFGDWYYVPSKCRHKIKILEDTEMIVVARPPILTRIGRFYEKIFNQK